jgi:hypothetical protein
MSRIEESKIYRFQDMVLGDAVRFDERRALHIVPRSISLASDNKAR